MLQLGEGWAAYSTSAVNLVVRQQPVVKLVARRTNMPASAHLLQDSGELTRLDIASMQRKFSCLRVIQNADDVQSRKTGTDIMLS